MSPLDFLKPYRLWIYAALAFALIGGYFGWAAHQQNIGSQKVVVASENKAAKVDAKRAAVATPIAAKQEAAQIKIRTVFKTIIKEVPVYVKADDCPMPGGFRVLHDAAANGTVPEPAGIADAAPAPAADVAATVADNYGTYFETADRLLGLQAWVDAQQALKNDD